MGIGWADGEGGRPGFEVHVREVTPGAASDAMHDGGFYRPVRMTVAALKAALRSAVAARNELVKLFNMPTEIHTASIEGFNPLDPSPAAADKEDWSSAASAADGVPPARQSRAPNRQNRGVKASTGTKRKASPSKSSAPKAHRRGKKGRFVSTAASGGSQRASNGESDAKAALSRFQACPITVSDSTNLAAMAAEVLEACKQHGCYPAEGPEIFWEECKVGYAIRFPSNDGTGTFRRRYFKPPQPVNVCALKMAIMAALTFHRKLVSEEGRACCSGEGQGGGHGAGECASRAMHVDVSKGVQEDGDVFALLPRDEINRLALNFQHRIQQEDSNMRRSTSSSTLASGATIRVTWNGADETFDVHLIAPHAPEQLLEKLKLSRKNVSQMRALVGRAVEARNAHADKYHCQPSKISIEAVLS
uniref:Uncharacterized protein n=1 Tax=Vitrella brassicaformis TaxID=1169539 RepID=A0A7S1P4X1_9ALVE